MASIDRLIHFKVAANPELARAMAEKEMTPRESDEEPKPGSAEEQEENKEEMGR